MMALGSWDPSAESAAQAISIESAVLKRFITYSREEQLDKLAVLIDGGESQVLAGLMKEDHTSWQSASEELPDEELLHLIRFFTMAENLPGWEAGEHSPVIPLAKTLRKRGSRLPKELLLWIREVSNNRFLPYGPL